MAVPVEHDILFNFAASPIGAGLKRLYEYARWYDAHGGARFIVHPRCESLRREFSRNEFVVARQSSASRILRGVHAVHEIQRTLGTPACYYAYGIPMRARVGRLNWLHVTNVLTVDWRSAPLPLTLQLKFRILSRQMIRGLVYADIISAESEWSLALFDTKYRDRLVKSLHGSDDEMMETEPLAQEQRHPVAVVVGTYPYKALDESCRVFDAVKGRGPLTLHIFGDAALVPPAVRMRSDVVLRGNRPRAEVIAELRRARYYLSTTLVENSYNAASEGIFLAGESYISDIGPHLELVAPFKYDHVKLPGTTRPVLHVKRTDLSTVHLKSWADVIRETNQRIDAALGVHSAVQSAAGSISTHV